MSNVAPYTVTLPPALVAQLDAAAIADGRSRSDVVRRTLAAAFADDAALRADAVQRFQSLQKPSGANSSLAGRAAGFGPDRAPLAAPAARSVVHVPAEARAGAAEIPTLRGPAVPVTNHESRRAAALEQAQRDDAVLRARAMTAPVARPTSGPLDTPVSAPRENAAKAERQRLAEFHSRPAPKGAA